MTTAPTAALSYRFVTVIWGASFVESFLSFTARTLLATGNLPAFGGRAVYSIFTRRRDAEQIRQSPLYPLLNHALKVEFVLFEEAEIDPDNFGSHWVIWRRGYDLARRNGEMLFFLIPDVIYARDTLSTWAGRFEQGYRALYTPGPQVVIETLRSEFAERFPHDRPVIDLDREQLLGLLYRHLHPLIACMFRDGPRCMIHPEYALRRVPGEGFEMRIVASHPVCIDPSRFEVTEALCPKNYFDDVCFEACSTVSAEPMLKHVGWYYRRWQMDDSHLSNHGGWLDTFAAPTGREESAVAHSFSWARRPASEGFRAAAAASDFFIRQLWTVHDIYRTFIALCGQNCHHAATVVAGAHFLGRIRRRWTVRGAVTILAPNDGAFAARGLENLSGLFRPGCERDLIRFAMNHVVLGAVELGVGEYLVPGDGSADANRTLRTAGGAVLQRTSERTDGAISVLAGPTKMEGSLIYVVDKVLGRMPAAESAQPRSSIPEEIPVPALAPRLRSTMINVYERALRTPFGPLAKFLYSAYKSRHSMGDDAGKKAPDAAAGEFLRARVVQGLLGMQEVLAYYDTQVLDGTNRSWPLRKLNELLVAYEVDPSRSLARFKALVERHPDFSEAWLELGFMYLERRQYQQALDCFERSGRCEPRIPLGGNEGSPAAQAAAGRGFALEHLGRLEEAVGALGEAVTKDSRQRLVHLRRGLLLRRLGREAEAVDHIRAAMIFDGLAVTMPKMPRDIDEMVI